MMVMAIDFFFFFFFSLVNSLLLGVCKFHGLSGYLEYLERTAFRGMVGGRWS